MSFSDHIFSRTLPPSRIECIWKGQILLIRPFEIYDAPLLQKAVANSLPILLPFMQWAHHPLTLEQQIQRLAKTRFDYFLGLEYHFGIFEKGSGAFLGCFGLQPGSRLNPHCLEMGYWISQEHLGKGLATLVSKILAATAILCLQAQRLQVLCNQDNTASRRVIEKCGFVYEGLLCDFLAAPHSSLLMNGFSEKRDALIYRLLPKDLFQLPWLEPISASCTIYTILGHSVPMQGLFSSINPI